MSSGVCFQSVGCYCSNGVAEYILDLCIIEFSSIDEANRYSHILEFFKDYREMFFGGLIVILEEDDFNGKEDFVFLGKLFERVLNIASGGDSQLTPQGRRLVIKNFSELVPALFKYGIEKEKF